MPLTIIKSGQWATKKNEEKDETTKLSLSKTSHLGDFLLQMPNGNNGIGQPAVGGE
jgi:hypothetical protein